MKILSQMWKTENEYVVTYSLFHWGGKGPHFKVVFEKVFTWVLKGGG
jgi:hypothetical protein